jgi:uncharacterized membrane protein YbhN (UPF0104 family)
MAFSLTPLPLHDPTLSHAGENALRATPYLHSQDVSGDQLTSVVALPEAGPSFLRRHRRFIGGSGFAALTLGAAFLLAQHLTKSSWPLQHAQWGLVAIAVVCYFASFIFRSLGWQQLFARHERPASGRCMASVGASAASGVVLPFRMDYLVKIGTFRKMGGSKSRIGFEALALSIVTLGLVDAVAMLPLSISATATTSSSFRAPLAVVVACGLGAGVLLLAGPKLMQLSLLRRSKRMSWLADKVINHIPLNRSTAIAWGCLVACWSTRAVGTATLLAALGVGFSFPLALALLCLGAAAAVLPLTSGGLVANVGATAGVLLALGVHKEQAINFSLASGMLLTGAALCCALTGVTLSLAMLLRPRLSAAFARH